MYSVSHRISKLIHPRNAYQPLGLELLAIKVLAILLKSHTNLVRSREAHPRGCSRAPFPVEVHPLEQQQLR